MVENKANPNRLGYVGSLDRVASRDSDTWFTPEKYITSARKALGGVIYLDPFSSDAANKVVQAVVYFTKERDALQQNWHISDNEPHRTLFMNPPYSNPIVKLGVTRLLDEYLAGSFDARILLVYNVTETKWFQRCLTIATAVCFTDHRIASWNVDGKAKSGNTRGQAFLYFGEEGLSQFVQAFDEHGFILIPAQPRSGTQTYLLQ